MMYRYQLIINQDNYMFFMNNGFNFTDSIIKQINC